MNNIEASEWAKETFSGCNLGDPRHDGCSGCACTSMVNGETSMPIGLIDQLRWIRPKKRECNEKRKQRLSEVKESYRWEAAQRRMVSLMGDASNVITLADREADIFEFLLYHLENQSRYVVRTSQNRVLPSGEMLWAHMEKMPILGSRKIGIAQRPLYRPES